jgi:YVTN family beta-propeller protein
MGFRKSFDSQTTLQFSVRALGITAIAAAAGLFSLTAQAQSSASLPLSRAIPLAGVQGRFDHFAVDLAGNRLFAAATGNHSVEVIDLKTDKVAQSITGLGKPHGLAWVADAGSLYVADGALAELRVYRGAPLKLAGSIKLSADADDMVYNGARHQLYVGHGGSSAAEPGKIAVIDTASFSLVANLPAASHPEALDLDEAGQRIFANIADSSQVAVIDGAHNEVASLWKLSGASDNVPMAYDGEHHVLYVACRTPATLIALDAASGAELSRVPTGNGADDLFYDASLSRVYVIGGGGQVDAFQVNADKKLIAIGTIRTAPGAKTALFVPSHRALYVGVPSTEGHPAEIRVFSTSAAQESK